MHILLWSPGGAGTHYYGPGTIFFRMYQRRDPDQLRVFLVHRSDQQENFPHTFERQVFFPELTPVRWLSISSSLSHLDLYRQRLIFIRRGIRWLDDHVDQFDVFHGMSNWSDTLLPALHAAKLGLPVCTTVMNLRGELEDENGVRRWLKFSDRRLALISRLDAVIALSRDIERTLVERGIPEEKVVYIPSGVNTSRFGPAESASEKSSLKEKLGLGDDPVIAFVGELSQRKGAHLLLQALRELDRVRFGWQLVLAGPPNDEAYACRLATFVDDQRWRKRVYFLGHVNNIEDVFKAADIFCLPSKDEGMPGALLEAMVSGLACIITPFSSARELIKEGTSGRIVPPLALAIADALRDYLCDERLRTSHGSAARQIALAGYSTEKVLKV